MSRDEKEILLAAFLLLAIIATAYGLASTLLGTRHFMITILSDSMKPSFERGDIAIIKNVENYSVRDVIAFGRNNDVYVHRLIAKEGDAFRTAGDSTGADQWIVQKSDVLGKVVLVVPKFGWINLLLAGK